MGTPGQKGGSALPALAKAERARRCLGRPFHREGGGGWVLGTEGGHGVRLSGTPAIQRVRFDQFDAHPQTLRA